MVQTKRRNCFLICLCPCILYLYVQKHMFLSVYAYECLCTSMCVDGNEYESYVNAYAHANKCGLKTESSFPKHVAEAHKTRIQRQCTIFGHSHCPQCGPTVKKNVQSVLLRFETHRHRFDAAYLIEASAFLFSNMHQA